MYRIIRLFPFFVFAIAMQAQVDTLETLCLKQINTKVNFYQNTTIDGLQIDSNYFKGKITILSFFGFNCAPCEYELGLLNDIRKTYPKDKYQILFIVDGNLKDARDLRAYNSSKRFRGFKRRMGVDTLAFDIIADCPKNKSVGFGARPCKGSNVTFKIYALPTCFFINREGIIKEICMGYAMPRTKEFDDYFFTKLKEAEK